MILVTGATGRVGTHLVAALMAEGENVRVLARHGSGVPKGVDIKYGDITDMAALVSALDGVDTIYHLAAVVDYQQVRKRDMYRVNVLGTENLIKASKAKRLVYQSTTSVYGERPEDNPATEGTRCNPYSFYGRTKMLAERIVLEHGGVVVRCPVIMGPSFNKSFYPLLARLAAGTMPVIGQGNNRLQWIHIRDLVDALLLAERSGKDGNVYLVAGKEVISQEKLLATLARELGVRPPTAHVPVAAAKAMAYLAAARERISGRAATVLIPQVIRISSDRTYDITKARKELGFRPKVGYGFATKEMVAEYRQHIGKNG